jgi:hypothetical protein
MDNIKLIQSIGNVAARNIEGQYRSLQVKFFAMKGPGELRVFIADREDATGKTGRLFDLGALPPQPDPIIIKNTLTLLEERIETQVKQFLGIQT